LDSPCWLGWRRSRAFCFVDLLEDGALRLPVITPKELESHVALEIVHAAQAVDIEDVDFILGDPAKLVETRLGAPRSPRTRCTTRLSRRPR
jgi:hypothetical protein